VFERSQSIGVVNQGQSELYQRLSDDFTIVVKLIGGVDVEKGSESENRLEIQNEIEKLMNLKHPCVAAPFGFVVSSTWTELKLVRAYAPIGSLEEILQTSPSWWTATARSIAVVGIALGMRFVHSFGFVWGNLKPSNIVFNESHRIQIVDVIPNWAELHSRENFDESVWTASRMLSEFAAPEVLFCRKLTQKVDVFAFASILFTIVVGHRPFGETAERSGRSQRPLIVRDALQAFVPDFVSQLILSGLSTNPNDRPSFNEIIEILKENDFRITEEVDSEAVSAFVSSLELSEQ
jgi:serine/threonine protein kinase